MLNKATGTNHVRLLLVLLVQAMPSRMENAQYTICDKLSSCACRCGDRGVVDLSAVGLKNGEPRFKDMYDSLHYCQYSYNPCYDFTESDPSGWQNNCNGVASCQIISIKGFKQYYDCGQQSSVQFTLRPGKDVGVETQDVYLVAEYASRDKARTTQVVFLCHPGGKDELTVLGEIVAATPTYKYFLTSPSACYKSEGSLSAGSVLLIVFLAIVNCTLKKSSTVNVNQITSFACLLVAYLIAGISYQKFVRKSTGKELCPNYSLWSTIPGRIKDGFFFVVSKLKGLTTKQYQPVK